MRSQRRDSKVTNITFLCALKYIQHYVYGVIYSVLQYDGHFWYKWANVLPSYQDISVQTPVVSTTKLKNIYIFFLSENLISKSTSKHFKWQERTHLKTKSVFNKEGKWMWNIKTSWKFLSCSEPQTENPRRRSFSNEWMNEKTKQTD